MSIFFDMAQALGTSAPEGSARQLCVDGTVCSWASIWRAHAVGPALRLMRPKASCRAAPCGLQLLCCQLLSLAVMVLAHTAN